MATVISDKDLALLAKDVMGWKGQVGDDWFADADCRYFLVKKYCWGDNVIQWSPHMRNDHAEMLVRKLDERGLVPEIWSAGKEGVWTARFCPFNKRESDLISLSAHRTRAAAITLAALETTKVKNKSFWKKISWIFG